MKKLLFILFFVAASCKVSKQQQVYHWQSLEYRNNNDTIHIILDSLHFIITKERSVLHTPSDSTLIWLKMKL